MSYSEFSLPESTSNLQPVKNLTHCMCVYVCVYACVGACVGVRMDTACSRMRATLTFSSSLRSMLRPTPGGSMWVED